MSLRINHNTTSLSTYANLNRTSGSLEKSIAKLSSGLRINSAADDAAGLAISEKMRSQIGGLNRAKLNAQDGISMIQSAEGGLNETESIIQRMRELAIQASNDTLTSNDRLEIQKEINQLRDAIDDIADSTEFNTKKLLNGSQTALVSSSSRAINGVVNGAGVNGGDFNVSMTVIQAGISQVQTSQMFSNKDTGNLAAGNTKLEDIAQFYDENGVFALDTAQKLTITGNSQSYEFTIDGKMTLNELASSLQNALSSANGLGIKNSAATVVSTATSGISGVGGYLQLTSGSIGDIGKFALAGDQKVIDALGLTTSREAANNIVQLKMTDATGNARTVNTSSDKAAGLLNGIDLQFESQAAQIAGNGGIVDGLEFTGAETLTFNIKTDPASAGTDITVNFAQGEAYSMEGLAKAINAKAEAAVPNSGFEATVVDGQIRLGYNPTNSKAPTEIEVKAGSDTLGINTGTYTGFVDGDKNMDNVVRGMSQLATAAGTALTVDITDGAGNTATINFGTTVTAGADLVKADDLVMSANNALKTGSVNARVDIVNGSIAFTSTVLGQKNNNGQAATKGTITVASSDEFLNNKLGYKDGMAKGAGDTNFRLHVVDNSPSFQIGANAGQNMKISIGNMSAKALGIDKLDMSSVEGAQSALSKIDNALSKVSAERSKLGSYSNRLNYTISNLENTATNLTEAESRIRDVDMASEMINFTSNQIKQQAGTAMLAQANSMSQSILSLLQG